jgi:rfaE bifunctional protein kinase chain/domain
MKLKKAELDHLFGGFEQLKVMIIGDVMVDAYYWGKVDRISPEAPVPIVAVEKKESRLGGAANVALNIQSLGASPLLCSVIGEDQDGDEFITLLGTQSQSRDGIVRSSHRRTTRKSRVIGNNHQMLRIDSEDLYNLKEEEEQQLLERIQSLLQQQEIDVIIFEDYDKGVITPGLIKGVVRLAQNKQIPTVVDPKRNNFLQYQKVDLFKPNLKELAEGLKIDIEKKNLNSVRSATQQLEQRLNNKMSLITLSESGVFIHSSNEEYHIHAHRRDITDVSGAGDTVIAVAALCLALDQPPRLIAELANLAGGLVCEKVGVVPVDKTELQAEAEALLTS